MTCLACHRPVSRKHTYCSVCRKRLRQGWQCLDGVDAIPVPVDRRQARVRGPLVLLPGYLSLR
jgi:hypothetical protein